LPASAELLLRAAAETGFQAAALEKVVRLGELAGDVARHPLLGKALALKGGTALNLCWGMPSRLSVDLDYNVIGDRDRAAMLEARPRVERGLEDLGRRRGYLVQRSPDTFAGRKIFLGYTSAFGAPERLEVDLNFVFRTPIAATEVRPLWQPGGLDAPQTVMVSLSELCIGKLLALLDRGAPRDA
jgi:predicted nucleotidyltransferase component of viral defense system